MFAIPADYLAQLKEILLVYAPVGSDKSLRNLFIDSSIAPWQYRLPEASHPAGRVDNLINYLAREQNKAGENILILFLRVLQDRQHPEFESHAKLGELADELAEYFAGTELRQLLSDEPAPYRGLAVFDDAQADFFFGREAESEQLWSMIQTRPFVAVVGVSGRGKSSLVRAGLMPQAKQAEWHTLTLKPYTNPIAQLTIQLENLLQQEIPPSEVLADPDVLTLMLTRWFVAQSEQTRLLLVIDQFEELFTLTTDEQQRQQFIALLSSLTKTVRQARLVITLRTRFLDHCLQWPQLADLLRGNQFPLGSLTEDGLRRAIEQPAVICGAEFETGLVNTLIRDVENRPEALPLLQSTLDQLWQRRDRVWLTHIAYDQLNGISGAISTLAENVYQNNLTSVEQKLARQVFLRLLRPYANEDNRQTYTLRRIERAELNWVDVTQKESTLLVAKLTGENARLLTSSGSTLELTHEALAYHWARLADWLRIDEEKALVLQALADSAQKWQMEQGQLYVRRQWRRVAGLVPAGELSQLEQSFLQASRHAASRRLWLQAGTAGLIMTLIVAVYLLWQQLQSPWTNVFDADPVTALAHSQDNFYFGTANTGVARQEGEQFVRFLDGLPTGIPADDDPDKNVQLISRLTIDRQNADRVLAVVAKCGLYLSEDSAESWQDITGRLPTAANPTFDTTCNERGTHFDEISVVDVDLTAEWAFVTLSSGLYVRRNEAGQWALASDEFDLPEGRVLSVAVNPAGTQLYLGTTTGLYTSPLTDRWFWQAVGQGLSDVLLLTPAGEHDLYYFVSYDSNNNDSHIYRWQPGQLPQQLGTVDDFPIQLAPDFNLQQARVFLLHSNGQIIVVTADNEPQAIARTEFFLLDLLASCCSNDGTVQLWLADEPGLFFYSEDLD